MPAGVKRRYPPYAQMADGQERRRAIIDLYFDGWNIASIAGYLETNRPRVYETLYRFFSEDFAGLPDKSRAPKQPARKVDLQAMTAVRRLQANPELGEFRIHAALKQLGIHLSPRTCGRILALNRQLGLLAPAAATPHEQKEMPFAASYRHEYWSVDVRYIEDHQLEQRGTVYVISVLDNYSRVLYPLTPPGSHRVPAGPARGIAGLRLPHGSGQRWWEHLQGQRGAAHLRHAPD